MLGHLTQPRPLGTPVLFIVFNRPETTRRVLDAIRDAKPTRLYVAGDGPRSDHPGEAGRVKEVRKLVVEGIDWDCEVKTLFRSENLGCKAGVSGAIDWFFDSEEEGIILEDDCLPDRSFFFFCEDLLARYREDQRVMHVAGACLVSNLKVEASYFFSKYPAVWGWATWRTAWSRFSLTTTDFETEFRSIDEQFQTEHEKGYWRNTLNDYFAGQIDTWDYPWAFSIWQRNGLAVYPKVNLVKNIGFGEGSTHTKSWRDYRGLGDLELQSIERIVHPTRVVDRQDLDERVFEESYRQPPRLVIAFKLLRRLVAGLFRRHGRPREG